jgi:hypothetical protein
LFSKTKWWKSGGKSLGPYKLHPMKMNWLPFGIKECLVFKPSSVQYEADGLTNVERNTSLVALPENEGSSPSIGTKLR